MPGYGNITDWPLGSLGSQEITLVSGTSLRYNALLLTHNALLFTPLGRKVALDTSRPNGCVASGLSQDIGT